MWPGSKRWSISVVLVLGVLSVLALALTACDGEKPPGPGPAPTERPDGPDNGPTQPPEPAETVNVEPTGLPEPEDQAERIFYDDFSSLVNWDTSSYRWHGWSLDHSCESEPPCAAYVNYRSSENALLGRAFTLPDASPITLRFRAWYETEPKYDTLGAYVHHQGRLDPKYVAIYSGSSSGWIEAEADLTEWAGDDVEIWFEFDTDRETGIVGGGARIDDVELLVGGPRAPAPAPSVELPEEDVITRQECEQVQLGMSYDDVVQMLQAPGEYNYSDWGQDYFTWMNPDGTNIVLGFSGDLLATKTPCDYLPVR